MEPKKSRIPQLLYPTLIKKCNFSQMSVNFIMVKDNCELKTDLNLALGWTFRPKYMKFEFLISWEV